ncbi:uncharacterized protein LOC101863074 [Aplysia californica]|uniref:Uncharacterized protein LOC101863074 n=1 Tax=Aplysia californica TaxID=6500 RepID=A0ABM1W3Y1_APLCA|nr:uncharacterized protein LOC101863074 [Aplysia californica]
MSVPSSPTRSTQDPGFSSSKSPDAREKKPIPLDSKLENRLTMKDLERLRSSFMVEGDGYDNKLSLTKEQFCEALSLLLKKGTREEYAELFDKIDVTREGTVDWDRLASHMLLEFYEKDDRVKSTQVPQWKDIKMLPSPHKEIVQRVAFLKNTNRYIAISKEGCVSMWGSDLKLQRHLKTGTDTCKMRDLWVTDFVLLQNVNKIALAFTSKEIAIYDLSSKLEFNCQYKVQGLNFTPLCLDYWSNPNNANDAILVWGDVGGFVNILFFNSANIALFERPPAPAGEKQEPCLNVQLKDIVSGKYKNATYAKYEAHNEKNRGEWVRQVIYSQYLECFISCATTTSNAVVIGWMEKHQNINLTKKLSLSIIYSQYLECFISCATTTSNAVVIGWMEKHQNINLTKGKQTVKKGIQRKNEFNVSQGVNAFGYNENLNLIATAGVNNHVCLWNPYVVNKPNGVLRGHMASVIQVQFIAARSQLISFSKDKVLRIWDVQLQVCIQRLAGMFPKGPEVTSTLFFDDGRDRSGQERNRLFITFNYQLTAMDMKTEVKDRIMSHEKPVVATLYNSVYNQIVSVCQAGTITMWLVDTGQKVKQFNNTHGNSEVTCLTQDQSETRLYTGSTDGTVKPTFHGPEKSILGGLSTKLPDIHGERTGSSSSKSGSIRGRRSANRISQSQGSGEEANEFGWAVARLIFLENRRGNSASGGANLVSCGGNGWVRFWNASRSTLLAEFVAHRNAGSIIMTSDPNNHYLVTADVDGVVKVWEIQHYALSHVDEPITTPPVLKSQFQPHQDQINSLDMCERNERLLIVSASSDCSLALWDIFGNRIGVFGQEEHWKIEPLLPQDELEDEEEEKGEEEDHEVMSIEAEEDSHWEPDEMAVVEPSHYRINTWDRTVLGKDYQELRVQKRERRQPGTIPDLPYLHWERTGAPPAGPYSALDTKELKDVQALVKPDAEKYFNERPGSSEFSSSKLPALAETLMTAFDEKSLFPGYILDFERKMKNYHSMMLNQNQAKGKNLRGSLQNIGMQMGQPKAPMSPRKSIAAKGPLGLKLRGPGTRKSSIATTVAD